MGFLFEYRVPTPNFLEQGCLTRATGKLGVGGSRGLAGVPASEKPSGGMRILWEDFKVAQDSNVKWWHLISRSVREFLDWIETGG